MTTLLLTGAAGRIGRCLLAQLPACGFEIRATDIVPLDHPGFVRADLNDADALARLCAGVDAVVHLAGHPSSSDWAVLEQANTTPTRRLFEAAGAAGVKRIVYASSIHVAGYASADVRLDDFMPRRPDGPYGLSKAMGELLLGHACDRFGLAGVALRICSFRLAPGNARELRTWLSPGDMVRLAAAALRADMTGFRTVWGLSANRRADVDTAGWQAIGYEPADDAEAYAASLAAGGVETGIVSEWPYLGGAFVEPRP